MIGKILSPILGFFSAIFTNIIPFFRQNFKRIILSFLAFALAFLIVTIILFPKTTVAKSYIDRYLSASNLPITYSDISIGYFGSTLRNVDYDSKINISTVKVSYNPIGLIMKRITVDIDSKFATGKITIKGDDITVNAKTSLELLLPLFAFDATGAVNIIGSYNQLSKKGDIKISSNNIVFAHPMMTVKADSLNSSIVIDGVNININQFEAKGSNSVTASGKIMLMTQNIQSSILDIKGNANLSGLESSFSLTGNLNAPQFSLQ